MIKLQAQNEKGWPFLFYIEKAIAVDENDNLIVEGVASTVNIDHDQERMADTALHSMSDIINDKGVPLRLEHSKEDSAIIGTVYKAWVDERNNLWIRAVMEKGNQTGSMIHGALKQGAKFGLSVGGRVKNAVRELSEATGKMVKTFYDVVLDEVSVTKKPANYDAWLFAKSYKEKDTDVTSFYKSPLYNDFLFENQQLDYLRQFAKSIPDKAWSKIISNNIYNKNMKNDKDEETKKAEDAKEADEKESTKSFVTKGEFSQFSALVSKGFKDLTKAIAKAIGDTPAKDAVNPDKSKEIPDEQQTAKTADDKEGEDKTKAEKEDEEKDTKKAEDGDKKDGEEKEKAAGDQPKDQEQPDKAKPVVDTQQTAKKLKVKHMTKAEEEEEDKKKAAEGDKKDGEEKEKSADDDEDKKEKSADDEEGEDKKKAEDKKDDMDSATKSIASLLKRMTTVEKSEKVEKSSKISPIDRFAVTVATALDAMTDRFEKSGIRVPGLAQLLSDTIKNDPTLQAELSAMVKMPGFKKSVSMGVPYMVTKEGKRFALSATPVAEKIAKSEGGADKTFKSVYQSKYAAYGDQQ